jgi:hypothetical protein
MWVPFNEGWGQYDTPRIVQWIKSYDPSRLVDNASGWTDAQVGDVSDIHRYPGPGAPKLESSRAAVLGEFGGLGLPLPEHTWQSQANWSYRGFTSRVDLTDAYVDLTVRLHPLLGTPGLSAAVYTQTTDVEIEVNGLMTYDRAIVKPELARTVAAARDQVDSRELARHARGLALHADRAARRVDVDDVRRQRVDDRSCRLRRAQSARQRHPHAVDDRGCLVAPLVRPSGGIHGSEPAFPASPRRGR